MARWNPADHPRYPNGTFRPKLSQSIRLSPRSISYNAGVRVPVVPGRAQLYVGALVRVERVNGSNFLQKHVNAGVNKIATKFGDKGGKSNLARILKGDDIQVGRARIQARVPISTPTFRVSSTPHTRENARVVERVPRRTRRTRSSRANLPRTVTAGISTQPPRARRPRKVTRSRARAITNGRKIRR